MTPKHEDDQRVPTLESGQANEPPWYRRGLRFTCHGCGNCCRRPGYVWLTVREIDALALHLGLARADFTRRYVRWAEGRLALVDRADGACIFLDESCTVYEARPRQCRTFPFWPQNLESPEAWRDGTDDCCGAGTGRRYDVVEIRRLATGAGETGSEPG